MKNADKRKKLENVRKKRRGNFVINTRKLKIKKNYCGNGKSM